MPSQVTGRYESASNEKPVQVEIIVRPLPLPDLDDEPPRGIH